MPQREDLPYRLMTPGPVPVPSAVLEALALPMIHHRTPEFSKIFQQCLEQLKIIFGTQQAVMMLSSTGSGAMEAALVNTLSPGDEVLSIISGKFGERWADMAQAYGMRVTKITVPWGEAVDLKQIKSLLTTNPDIKAVLCQACETSTATAHPIQEIAALLKEYPSTLFMVDAITAIGSMPLKMDEWGIDVVVAGSQKAFMLPTGLAFISLSEKAWLFNKRAKTPRYYWDLKAEYEANLKQQSYFSSSVTLIRALNVVLAEMTKQGMDHYIKRCEALAKATHAGLKLLGLKIFSKAPANAVTAILLPEGIGGEKLRDHIEAHYNITLMGGQDQLKNRILRMGHLGYISNADTTETVRCIGMGLIDMNWKALDQKKVDMAADLTASLLKGR